MENKLFSLGTNISRSITCPSVSGLSFDAPAQVDTCEQPVPCVKGSAIFPCSLDQGRGKTHWNASIYILFSSPGTPRNSGGAPRSPVKLVVSPRFLIELLPFPGVSKSFSLLWSSLCISHKSPLSIPHDCFIMKM